MGEAQHCCGECEHFESRQGNLGECRKRRMAVWADGSACAWDFEAREEANGSR